MQMGWPMSRIPRPILDERETLRSVIATTHRDLRRMARVASGHRCWVTEAWALIERLGALMEHYGIEELSEARCHVNEP
jgi:hypothetical protein